MQFDPYNPVPDHLPLSPEQDAQRVEPSGQYKAEPQVGKPGHCMLAQVFAPNKGAGDPLMAVLTVEPTEDPAEASRIAEICATALSTPPAPPPVETGGEAVTVPSDKYAACEKALREYSQFPTDYHRSVLRMREALQGLVESSTIASPAAQAQERKPLPAGKINDMWRSMAGASLFATAYKFARDIEAAHGITAEDRKS